MTTTTPMTAALRPPQDPAPTPTPTQPSRWRGHREKLGLATLLVATAVLYLWGLSASGWANEYYAAAVQAGTQSWKALLFGSIDSGNAITVDKPPAALWVMGLSGRLLGFSSFSLLLPQALMGIGSVALLHAAVRRVSGAGAGLLAGTILAATPVAALMFRFDNPDALLVLLLVAAAYCTVRATETGSIRWLATAGGAVGFAFLAKMLQAFLVVPAFALVFLLAAPVALGRRLLALVVAAGTMVLAGGWFVALVALWPSASRPYIGGSTDNSLLELALGYNGVGRVLGGAGNGGGGGGAGGPGGGNTMFGGSTGITRLFGLSMGTEISWLLPAALIGMLAGLWFTRRTPRTGRTRAALLLWGGWLIVTGLVFSFMKGTVHPYYTVALAPAIAALVATSVRELWRGRKFVSVRIVLAAVSIGTGVWNVVLLDRTSDWFPSLRWIVLAGSVVVASVIAVGAHALGRMTVVVAAAGLLFGLAGTAAYTVDTALTSHSGSIPSSGPAQSGGAGGPMGGGPGGPGGDMDTAALGELLDATHGRWAAATVGAHTASTLELDTGESVMAIGGFTGSDESPTLAQFQQYVADGQIGYFVTGGEMGGGGPGGPGGGANGTGSAIASWVSQHYTATTVGGTTVYDLGHPTAG